MVLNISLKFVIVIIENQNTNEILLIYLYHLRFVFDVLIIGFYVILKWSSTVLYNNFMLSVKAA